MSEPLDTDASRAHLVTAIQIENGRGTTLHHCTTCGALTYFQSPPPPCPGSLREALDALTASRGQVAMLTTDRDALAAEVERLRAEIDQWRMVAVMAAHRAVHADCGCSPESVRGDAEAAAAAVLAVLARQEARRG
jgi:hypothetical protein